MHQIDESFKKTKAVSAARKRRLLFRRIAFITGSLGLLGLGVLLLFTTGVLHLRGTAPPVTQQEVAASGDQPSDAAVFVPAIVDLAGDPMKITLGGVAGADQAKHFLPRPDGVPPDRVADQVVLLSDTMVTTSQRFMTTLPSSPQDFAFYQAQQVRAPDLQAVSAVTPVPADTSGASVDTPGAPATAGTGDLGAAQETGTATPTAPVENTTSVAVVRGQDSRFLPDQDFFSKVLVPRSLSDMILENRLQPDDATAFDAAMKAMLNKSELDIGDVVAIRAARQQQGAPLAVVQVSVYNSNGYIGTMSRGDGGAIVVGADPWVFQDLFHYSDQKDVAQAGQQYRLLDAIYSTGARNGVPTEVLGEAIMLLSRSFDLNAFASADDKLLLAFGKTGDAQNAGRLLFAGVSGTGRDFQCYVYKSPSDPNYSCSKGTGVAGSSGSMVTPVAGALTAKFGLQVDPRTKKTVQNTGVDWTAPLGSPVVAAYAGTVTFAAPGQGGGFLVKVALTDGRETTYFPLQALATGISIGRQVSAGGVLGTVGTTDAGTGPHLHFEVHQGGAPIDPLQVVTASQGDGSGVDSMIDRIVQIESGGSATAANPTSTAVGCGQFITTTWLRMIKTYRPDLATSNSDQQILALRTDCDLSKQMVANLAREGAAYLTSKGITVTPGRIYLCHFLGMQAAVVVSSASPDTPLSSLVDGSVISANNFLTGFTSQDIQNWSDKKMSGHSGVSVPAEVVSPEFIAYKTAVDTILASATTAPADGTTAPPAGTLPTPVASTGVSPLTAGTASLSTAGA